MASYFQITRNSPLPNRSLISPAATAVRGTAFQESATAGTAELADGTVPIAGFVARAIEADPLTFARLTQVNGVYPTSGLDIQPGLIPFKQGNPIELENAEEVDVEGSDYIDDITANTALKTEISFSSGKFHVATAGQYAEFILVEKPTVRDVGNVRARLVRCPGHIKAA